MSLTHPKYIQLRDLILKSEGKTIEDELGIGCVVSAYSYGIFMHRASNFYYSGTEAMNLKKPEYHTQYCGFKPYQKIKFSCCGFQTFGESWKQWDEYPKFIEIYMALFGGKYKPTEMSDVYKNEVQILGCPIALDRVLMALGKVIIKKEPENAGVSSVIIKGDFFIAYKDFYLKWTLGKPLHEQTEETWDQLIKILS